MGWGAAEGSLVLDLRMLGRAVPGLGSSLDFARLSIVFFGDFRVLSWACSSCNRRSIRCYDVRDDSPQLPIACDWRCWLQWLQLAAQVRQGGLQLVLSLRHTWRGTLFFQRFQTRFNIEQLTRTSWFGSFHPGGKPLPFLSSRSSRFRRKDLGSLWQLVKG